MPHDLPTVSVIVATYGRPEHVRQCLEHLIKQSHSPDELVVVDASPDDRTRQVVAEFSDVRYLRNDHGAGTLATSRAIGMRATRGEVVAFIDDDAFAEPDWLEQLLRRYDDPGVAAVGGRARNGRPGEEQEGLGQIGRLLPNGRLTGYFAADPGRDVETDHMLGANMSYRRSVAETLGGIHEHYPGTCLREDTDMPLRMRVAGHRVLFTPDAVVEHVAAPYVRGQRFDLRYAYFGQRNHVVLLARTLGMSSSQFKRYWGDAAREIGRELAYVGRSLSGRDERSTRDRLRAVGGGISRAAVKGAGLGVGAVVATRLRWAEGPPPAPVADFADGR